MEPKALFFGKRKSARKKDDVQALCDVFAPKLKTADAAMMTDDITFMIGAYA